MKNEELCAHLKYGDKKVEFSGKYDDVWDSINRFLAETYPHREPVIVTREKKYKPRKGSLGEKIVILVSNGWFDTARSSGDVSKKLTEEMAFKCKIKDVRNELIRMVRREVLKRKKTNDEFTYFASWIRLEEETVV